jgi:HK97 family phage prohead protease
MTRQMHSIGTRGSSTPAASARQASPIIVKALVATTGVLDQAEDLILPGAFRLWLALVGGQPPSVPILYAHRRAQHCVLGRVTSASEGPEGLLIVGELWSDYAPSIDAAEALEQNIFQWSIGARPLVKPSWRGTVRVFAHLEIEEVSVTPDPLHRGTKTFSVKRPERNT